MRRIGVLGAAGGVGAVTAAALVADARVDELLLVDRARDRLAVQVMDLRMLATAVRDRELLLTVAEPAELTRADVVLCAAGVPHRDGRPRSAFAVENWALLREVLGRLSRDWDGLFLVASNPVDVLATLVSRHGPTRASVAGLVVNDSLRMAGAVADVVGVPPQRVHVPVAGEHGGAPIPLWQLGRLDGAPQRLTPGQRRAAVDRYEAWYPTWQAHATGTTTAWTTGHHLARTGLRWFEPEAGGPPVHPGPVAGPLSVDLSPWLDLDHATHVGVPAEVLPGRLEVVRPPLDTDQWSRLRAAAAAVAAQADRAHRTVAARVPEVGTPDRDGPIRV